jgi:diamine N-acetyltransferase
MTSKLRLETITPANVGAACRLKVRPEQEHMVAPVAWSLADAYANPDTAWPRLILDDDDVVGFVMGGFDPESPVEMYRCGIWRLAVSAEHQGRGYGRFAVREVLAEARRRGLTRATVSWVADDGGPAEFYLKLGFRPTGEVVDGQIVGEIFLP